MWRGEWQPGSPLPQIEFYALRAEAYIQLCDFSSAAQNLRMAHASQPDNTNYLERLTLVLYLKVPGAVPGPHMGHPPHTPGPLALPPAMGALLVLETSPDSLGTSLSLGLCPHLLPLPGSLPPPELVCHQG